MITREQIEKAKTVKDLKEAVLALFDQINSSPLPLEEKSPAPLEESFHPERPVLSQKERAAVILRDLEQDIMVKETDGTTRTKMLSEVGRETIRKMLSIWELRGDNQLVVRYPNIYSTWQVRLARSGYVAILEGSDALVITIPENVGQPDF